MNNHRIHVKISDAVNATKHIINDKFNTIYKENKTTTLSLLGNRQSMFSSRSANEMRPFSA